MSKVTAKDIVRSVGMSCEIEAHLTHPQDLDGDTLYYIFNQIAIRIGYKQAASFGNMIMALEPLSTVNFLYSLYQLEEADWDLSIFNYRNGTVKKRLDFLISIK